MAIVTKYSSALRDPSVGKAPKALVANAVRRGVFGSVAVANGDSIGSKFYFGKVPSSARIEATSMLRYTAITSGAMNVGFDISGKEAALVSAQSIASAGSTSLTAAVALADLGKPAWQIAGYTSDPCTALVIVGTLSAAAAAAGTVVADIQYAK